MADVFGGVEEGETASQTALREIQEETGLQPYAFYSADTVETFYVPSLNTTLFVPVFVAFVKETEIQLSPTEHDAYEWLSFDEARERLVFAEQRRVITHIHTHFVLKAPHPILQIELSPT